MHKTKPVELKEIHSWDEVPDFQSEAEEAEFWSNHCLGDEILTEMASMPEDIPPQRSNKILRYAVVIEKLEENYSGYVPDLPGCVAVGNTLEEVKQKIKDIITSHLANLQADGIVIREPKTECDYVEVISVAR